ncbi:hypothetical protein GCM10010495_74140 [Kitasatospora herbaricolor]|uniref:DUF6213 family protein n=1 Tax=Kitasatospora herbaricolor TaxID=68217 RepID=UPI001748A165|nr:DUF6213 family protein [Kitasatospora herbaricolor]MDQ0305466.1 hypothetical protein [Kitasatospora herbaricolor]GGV45712.1 hypothetical protein GCM10010495_74140 [Kitasatospora herbaricolor]
MTATGVQLGLRNLDGKQHLAVADVTAMLRSFSSIWQGWAATGHADLDPHTVGLLGSALADFADQLDVEAIARTAPTTGTGR